ncbi:putative bolA-like protein C4B3.11c [Beauveria bassiana]|uniref:Putative bolA-like protein C4B3.11c n=1 Tax=Beauveria bassiana TaxID=176275 RepID=A0A2N6N8S0_BEABA|nr:putative bolA-like protein C4B3.11c [Beauveria bassiana]
MLPSSLCAACRRAAIVARPLLTTTTTRPPVLARQNHPRLISLPPRRLYSSSSSAAASSSPIPPETPSMSPAETAIAQLLTDSLSPSAVLVQDVSGGCGSMYAIEIEAEAFRGQTILKQQRMVNAALGDVVKSWHGVQIRTRVPGS